MVNNSLCFCIRDIEFILRDNSPACLWNHPEGCNSLVLREVVSLWHVLIPKIDFEAWAQSSLCSECVVEKLKISGVLWAQAVKRPSIHMLDQTRIEDILQLDHSVYVRGCHAVIRNDHHIDNVSQISLFKSFEETIQHIINTSDSSPDLGAIRTICMSIGIDIRNISSN